MKSKKHSSRKFSFYLRRALLVLVSWTAVINVIFFFEYYTLKNKNALTSLYDFQQDFISNLIMAIVAGLIGGFITVNIMEYSLRRFAFWKALLINIIIFCIASIIVGGFTGVYFYSEELGLPIDHPKVLEQLQGFFKEWVFIKNFMIWLCIVIVTLIVFMVNDKFGPGVFPDYLKGRYFHPKREQRIFMFADIKDATTIAENLGEEKYFNFLKDFFKDIAPAIVHTNGEVYQYVGDEVVISWKLKKGLKHSNVLQCYYTMNEIIASKANKYQRKYGVSPAFKVGIHLGAVMVGEIGQIKREIVFSGDVLNTAARITAACNKNEVLILASKKFADAIKVLPKGVTQVNIGNKPLKGKAEEVALVTYTNTNS